MNQYCIRVSLRINKDYTHTCISVLVDKNEAPNCSTVFWSCLILKRAVFHGDLCPI